MTVDLVNGLFELSGGLFSLTNIVRILIDKRVLGVNIYVMIFFSIWGLWNLYYYPCLSQWFSFIGGILIVISNMIWTGLALYYSYKRRNNEPKKQALQK